MCESRPQRYLLVIFDFEVALCERFLTRHLQNESANVPDISFFVKEYYIEGLKFDVIQNVKIRVKYSNSCCPNFYKVMMLPNILSYGSV